MIIIGQHAIVFTIRNGMYEPIHFLFTYKQPNKIILYGKIIN